MAFFYGFKNKKSIKELNILLFVECLIVLQNSTAADLGLPLVKVVKNPSTIYLPLNKYFFDDSYKEH